MEKSGLTKMRVLIGLVTALFVTAVAGCGGGGGSPATSSNQGGANTVSGVASKGIIKNGTVKVYAVTGGAKGALLGQGSTDGNGAYSVAIGSYTGPVVAEASGSYLDEATKQQKTISEASPIRAVVSVAAGSNTVAVTAVTSLAYEKAVANGLTSTSIAAANALVADLFKVDDIIKTQPVAADAAGFQNATQAQKDYALVLSSISQLASDRAENVTATLSSLAQSISDSGLSVQAAQDIKNALTNFVANTNNDTGVKSVTGSNIASIGTTSMTFSTKGTLAAGTLVGGVDMTIVLPSNVTLQTDGIGGLASGVVSFSGVAGNSSLNMPVYTPASGNTPGTLRVAVLDAAGFPLGAFMTLKYQVAPGTAAPFPKDFKVENALVIDGAGQTLSGVTIGF